MSSSQQSLIDALIKIEQFFKLTQNKLQDVLDRGIEHMPPLPKEIYAAFDVVYQSQSYPTYDCFDKTVGQNFRYKSIEFYLIKGDITQCKCDIIVNAANEQGLGCFLPKHKCVDNAIHLKAGPRLRLEESEIMKSRGELKPSDFIVTSAYHLPSKQILSILGPKWNQANADLCDQQLSQCYQKVILYANNKQKSVAFCSISTGVYGFPLERATKVALNAIINTLEYLSHNKKYIPKVAIILYDDKTYDTWIREAKSL